MAYSCRRLRIVVLSLARFAKLPFWVRPAKKALFPARLSISESWTSLDYDGLFSYDTFEFESLTSTQIGSSIPVRSGAPRVLSQLEEGKHGLSPRNGVGEAVSTSVAGRLRCSYGVTPRCHKRKLSTSVASPMSCVTERPA
jgi:hypothetical protein